MEILLVEDNRDHLELMAYLLRGFGHKPLSVGSGEAGLGVAVVRKLDLVVCDLMLTGMTGFEVAKSFKADARLRKIPLIAVSALNSDSVRKRALEDGFDGFISKPISPEKFVLELERFVKADTLRNTPLNDSPLRAPPESIELQAVTPSRSVILVVDDRQPNLDLARCLLEQFGFTVLTAGGVQAGLACARRELPSLILTDVHMGDGSGFDLVLTVRADPQLKQIPCILISATYLEVDPRVKQLDLDDANFILRPVEPEVLLAKIEACLAAVSVP